MSEREWIILGLHTLVEKGFSSFSTLRSHITLIRVLRIESSSAA